MASTQAVSGYAEIVRNTVSGILRSKVLYIILFLTIIIAAVSILPILYFQMASEAGEIDTAISLTSQTMGSIIGLWTTATYMLALFLGATAISSEVKTKTIVTVLSKPVDRWKFLLAKWVGIQAFLLFFFLVGMVLAVVIIQFFEAETSLLFWVGVAQSFLKVTILSALALSLATISTPVLSGALPILISILGPYARLGMEDSALWVRLLSKGFYLLLPASMPRNLLEQSFSMTPLDPDWGLYGLIILENAGFAAVLVGLGCFIFSTRELPLK